MTYVRKVIKDAAIGVAITDTPEGLSTIHRPGCAAVIWRRQPVRSFQDWVNRLDPSRLPRTRIIIQPGEVRDAVRHSCDMSNTPDCPEQAHLVDDVTTLAHGFAEIVGAPYLRVRLDVVTTNACKKFHIDAVSARLICTYRGTGTQYGISTNGAEPKRVFTASTGAPIILRGTLWPENPPSGLLHRSPPIAGTGETRLLLVLDPVFDPEEEI